MVRRDRMHTAADFLRWEPLLAEGQRRALGSIPPPRRLRGRRVPATIDGLTFEQLCRLWEIRTPDELFAVGAEVLLGVRFRASRARVLPWVGFANWLAGELERVTALWNAIPTTRTPEETAAGADRLNFGVFGVADWYARRMGMHDHDEAMRTPWVRIYQCMRNDAETALYRERLENIIRNKHK